MDTSDPEIQFDENGVCNHCAQYKRRVENELFADPDTQEQQLHATVEAIKQAGSNKPYDAEALAESVLEILRGGLRSNGREQLFAQGLDIPSVTERVAAVYRLAMTG